MKKLIPIGEVARILGCSKQRVHQLHDRLLPVKIGGRNYYDLELVERHVERRDAMKFENAVRDVRSAMKSFFWRGRWRS